MSVAGKTRLGEYELLSRLGAGGMGEVFLAVRRGASPDEPPLVVKTLLPHLADEPRFIEMFMREAKLASLVHSPRAVQILDYGEAQGTYYLVLEYVDGLSLKRLLKRYGGPLDPLLATYVAAETCAALVDIHRQAAPDGKPLNIVHRDVSPENVLVSYDGVVKVADFGIARSALTPTRAATTVGSIKGKYPYMSPEQASAQRVDQRTDVFAAGVVLYEMLAGTLPYTAPSEVALLAQVVEGEVTPLSEVDPHLPKPLYGIVEQALRKDPSERYQTMDELHADLRRVLAASPETGKAELAALAGRVLPKAARDELHNVFEQYHRKTADARTRSLRRPRRPWPSIALAATGLLALAAAAFLNFWPREPVVPLVEADAGTPSLAQVEVHKEPGSDPLPDAGARPAVESNEAVDAGSPRVVAGAEGDKEPSDAPRGKRKVTVRTEPACDVYVGKRLVGSAPVQLWAVNGALRLRLVNRKLGIDYPVRVKVPKGEKDIRVEVPSARLQVRVDPWAEVFIDGRKLGQTPFETQSLFAGRHLLRFENAELSAHKELPIELEPGEERIVRVKLP